MKSIFSICLLFTTAVSVFAQSEELNGIVGKSMMFPMGGKDGRLFYKTDPVAVINNDKMVHFSKKFEGRLQWDSGTGFSLSGLEKNDSGLYKVVKNDGTRSVEVKYQLMVYVPVSKPRITITHNKYPCTLLCTVERGTEATLSWNIDSEEKPFVTSPVHSAPDLYLTEMVERSGTYTCEAKNSVSNERSDPFPVGDHCTAPAGPSVWTIAASVIAAIAILAAAILAVILYRVLWKGKSQTSERIRTQTTNNPEGLLQTQSETNGDPTHL